MYRNQYLKLFIENNEL